MYSSVPVSNLKNQKVSSDCKKNTAKPMTNDYLPVVDQAKERTQTQSRGKQGPQEERDAWYSSLKDDNRPTVTDKCRQAKALCCFISKGNKCHHLNKLDRQSNQSSGQDLKIRVSQITNYLRSNVAPSRRDRGFAKLC